MDRPTTRYAPSGDLRIAYQVVGDGPLDLVFVPGWASNIEIGWELSSFAHFFERLASFSRLIIFDRRGNGMSDGIAGATPLEQQVDDVRAVIGAVGAEQPVLVSMLEGRAERALCGLAPRPGPRARPAVADTPPHGGTRIQVGAKRRRGASACARALGLGVAREPVPRRDGAGGQRETWARWQRLASGPAGAAASLALHGETDVRDVLPSVQCQTLVLRPQRETIFDERHSRYVADRIPERAVRRDARGGAGVGRP